MRRSQLVGRHALPDPGNDVRSTAATVDDQFVTAFSLQGDQQLTEFALGVGFDVAYFLSSSSSRFLARVCCCFLCRVNCSIRLNVVQCLSVVRFSAFWNDVQCLFLMH
ncbi:hypothetical protein WK23_15435 [Burkholderia vietnamiensis]|nr:hypothetical protein WK23_15435 [Burkholderia vietnamiensis]